MAVNRYAAPCSICGHRVPPNGGPLQKKNGKWVTTHIACAEGNTPEVIATTFNSGDTVYVNRRGRCEDAPCCGCCS